MVGGRVDKESKTNLEYFNSKIKNKLHHPLIAHFGEINDEKKNEIYATSKCFLFPIKWEELIKKLKKFGMIV